MKKYGFKALLGGIAIAALTASSPAMAAFEGFGQDIPLESAARQIVPEGFTVDFGDGVDPKTPVSWSSASDWQSALRSAVSKRGYSAQIGSSTVVISKAAEAPRPYASSPARSDTQKKATPAPAKPRPAPKAAVAQPEPAVGGGGFSIRPYRGGQAASAAPASDSSRLAGKGDFTEYKPASEGFSVAQGQMLHPSLSDWAAKAGWTVVWNSEFDYRIEASANFSGDFIDAATALVAAMSDARPAITVDFYKGNRVIVVSNKSSDEAN